MDNNIKTYITFEVAEENFGINTVSVIEFIKEIGIRPIPKSPDYVRGISKFREEFIVVLDLATLLKTEKESKAEELTLIVIEFEHNGENFRIGLAVDQIDEVMEIDEKSISEAPSDHDLSSDYIHGIHHTGDEFIFLLESKGLINGTEIGYLLDLKSKSIEKQKAKDANKVKTSIETFLTFYLNKEIIAFPANVVKEVISEYSITKVPLSDPELEGVFNLRGTIIPVVNVDKKFGISNEDGKGNCIAVLELQKAGKTILVGALLEEVRDVIEIKKAEIQNYKAIDSDFSEEFIYGVVHRGEEFIRLINTTNLFSNSRVKLD